MELDYEYLEIQRQETLANLKASEAKLKKLKAGEAEENIKVVEKQTEQAEEEYNSSLKNLAETEKTIENTIKQAEENLNDLIDDSANTITSYEQSIQTAKDSLNKTEENYQQSIDKNKELALSNVFYSLSVINTALDKVDAIINDEDLKRLSVLGVRNLGYLTQTEILYEESLVLKEKANQNYIKSNQDNNKENIEEAILSALNALNKAMDTLNYCYKTLENSVTTSSFTSTILDANKTTINSQITNVNTNIGSTQSIKHSLESAYISYDLNINSAENNLKQAQVNLDDAIRSAKDTLKSAQVNGEKQITTAQNQIKTAKQAWEVSKSRLEQIQASSRSEDIELAEAEVERVKASLRLLDDKIKKSVIRSPINGKITKINYEEGEQVPPNSPAVEILNETRFKIEVNISEVDITKIDKEDKVVITLDAFGEEKEFMGMVDSIKPAETIIQDVVYYEVVIYFDGEKSDLGGIKPGMTANITIHTEELKNALSVPSRSIIKKSDDEKIVRVLEGEEIVERKIETGLRGDDGNTQIISGIKEGEEIITYIE
jgi:HlyD family secretion protein